MVLPLAYYVIPTILVLIGIRKCREYKWGTCNNKIKLSRKVVIVTGANSGIGLEIAKDLAMREAQVIMACRNLDEAAKAICKIKRELDCSSVIVPMELDLASVRSVKNFAEEIKTTYSEVHLLINNAGVAYPKNVREKTKDGFEIHMGTNHLGHFLLTKLLLESLLKADSSRIIIITSTLHENGKIYLDDLNLEKVTVADRYANSKLANVYFCKELAKRMEKTRLRVFAACPGWVYTNLFRHYNYKWYQKILMLPIAFLFMRSSKQGAQTPLYCATEPSLLNANGCIYKDCKEYVSNVEFDDKISRTLWEISEKMINEVDKNLSQKGFPEKSETT